MAAKKPVKAGRPSLPKNEARNTIIVVRVQAEERIAFERAAKGEGMSLSKWIRKALKSAADSGSLLL